MRQIAGAVLIAAVALLSSRAAVAKTVRLCELSRDFDFLQPQSDLTLAIVLEKAVTATSLGAHPKTVALNESDTLFVRDGREWVLDGGNLTEPCRIDAAAVWAAKFGGRTIGVSKGKLEAAMLATLISPEGRSTAVPTLVVAARSRPHPLAATACPKGEVRLWKQGTDLTGLAVSSSGGKADLFVQIDGSPNLCIRAGTLVNDDRRLYVRIGEVESDYSVASLTSLTTPVTSNSTVCRTSLDRKSWTSCSASGQPVVIPRMGLLLERKVPYKKLFVALRVLSALPADLRCPKQAPPATDDGIVVVGTKLFGCIYAGEQGDNEGHMFLLDAAADTTFGPFSVAPCLDSTGSCKEAAGPTEPGQPWELDASVLDRLRADQEQTAVELLLRSATTKKTEWIERLELRRYAGALGKSERIRVDADNSDLAKYFCVPPFAGDDGGQLQAILRTKVDDIIVSHSYERRGDMLCPDKTTEVAQLPLSLSRGILDVEFYLGTELYLTRTLVTDDGVRFRGVAFYQGESEPTLAKTFAIRTVYGLPDTVVVGDWLCVSTDDPTAGDSIRLPPDRFSFAGTNPSGTRTEGSFSRLRLQWFNKYDEPSTRNGIVFSKLRVRDPLAEHNDLYCALLNRAAPGTEERLVMKAPADVERESNLDVILDHCPDNDCSFHTRSEPRFFGFHVRASLAVGTSVSRDRSARLGFGMDLLVFNWGRRLARHFSLSYLQAGLAYHVSWSILGNQIFDENEAANQKGTCVAGCGDVESITAFGELGPYGGPCLTYQPSSWFSVPVCAGLRGGMILKTRRGAGVFQQSDGRITKTGDKGDSHLDLGATAYLTVGLRYGY
jgi:hypothetical protein